MSPAAPGGAGERLIVFARAPMLGLVKTRIASALGAEIALAAHVELLGRVAGNLEAIRSAVICATPDDALDKIEPWRRPGWDLWPQGGGDLGDRLARAFQRSFGEGAERVVVIGSDCPDVRLDQIENAWRLLRSSPAVFGPARDGGYWLIGLSRMIPELFANMPWSSDRLLEATIAEVQRQDLGFELLETLADIDTAADWIEFQLRERQEGARD
jgi:rSAM/selenodomain-associated transferase 1